MEEEKKEIIETEPESVKSSNEELLNLKRNNSKKNSIIVVLVFVILLMLALVLLYYFNNKDKDNGENGGTPVGTVTPEPAKDDKITNDEAIAIAKEKLEMANKFTSEDKCSKGESEIADEDGYWCYYGTVDEFKTAFYNIFSSKLVYKDVMMEYKSFDSYKLNDGITTNIKIEADYTAFPKYVIDGNKVYRSTTPSVGNGYYNRMDKFSVDSITSDTIIINYVVIGDSNPDEPNESKEYEYSKATMILVKENGDWKISKATVQSMLYTTYEVGK